MTEFSKKFFPFFVTQKTTALFLSGHWILCEEKKSREMFDKIVGVLPGVIEASVAVHCSVDTFCGARTVGEEGTAASFRLVDRI
jgi:hypothetical protein